MIKDSKFLYWIISIILWPIIPLGASGYFELIFQNFKVGATSHTNAQINISNLRESDIDDRPNFLYYSVDICVSNIKRRTGLNYSMLSMYSMKSSPHTKCIFNESVILASKSECKIRHITSMPCKAEIHHSFKFRFQFAWIVKNL
ncbi:unnamed protein product [Gordionus sp. m RMFG-2023]